MKHLCGHEAAQLKVELSADQTRKRDYIVARTYCPACVGKALDTFLTGLGLPKYRPNIGAWAGVRDQLAVRLAEGAAMDMAELGRMNHGTDRLIAWVLSWTVEECKLYRMPFAQVIEEYGKYVVTHSTASPTVLRERFNNFKSMVLATERRRMDNVDKSLNEGTK